jgi:hypothetical protein
VQQLALVIWVALVEGLVLVLELESWGFLVQEFVQLGELMMGMVAGQKKKEYEEVVVGLY